MGSLRNPIGPLPSSIYWRRRAVAVAVLALLAVVVVWAVFRDAGESTSDDSKGGGGPAATITPGPSDSGPGISERPGGRDEESGSEASDGGSSGSDEGDGDNADDSKGGGSTGGSGWGDAGGGAGSDSGSTGGAGGEGAGSDHGGVPAGSSLPECRKGDVEVSLKSVKKTYGSGMRPRFKLAAENNRATACKLDFGPTATVVTVKDSEGATVWASDHCPRTKKPAYVQLPANHETTRTFSWYRKANAANCATPNSSSLSTGDYRIEVDLHGLEKVSAKFTLD